VLKNNASNKVFGVNREFDKKAKIKLRYSGTKTYKKGGKKKNK
jgi:hypothetical protein